MIYSGKKTKQQISEVNVFTSVTRHRYNLWKLKWIHISNKLYKSIKTSVLSHQSVYLAQSQHGYGPV